jgi:ribonuclease VapC
MTFVDASAIVAMLTEEADGDELAGRLAKYPGSVTSAIALYEAAIAIARRRSWAIDEAVGLVDGFIALARIDIVPIGAAEARAAIEAFDRFGKGRGPARLNMGDCFAYACAKVHGLPLLFKGDDFAKTDIAAA